MLDQERIFQHLFKEEWRLILKLLYRNKDEIITDSMLTYAANTFENDFLAKVVNYPKEDRSAKEDLITFYLLHHGKFYTISEPNYKKLIIEIVGRVSLEEARNYATLLPDDLNCQEILSNRLLTESPDTSPIIKSSQDRQPKIVIMPQFKTEIRETFDKKYVKVFLRDSNKLSEIQVVLNQLPSVKNVNITQNKEIDLTVYPKKVYTAEEVDKEVNDTLSIIFASSAIDPIVKDDVLSDRISGNVYRQILDLIYYFGKNLEKFASLRTKFDEEGYREYFLPYLNSMSQSHTATGETFNKIGKTDILIQNTKGENVFIAECKVWSGEREIRPAIDQLLERYVNWRDEKLALIIFNKTAKGFSDLIDKAIDAIEAHQLCKKYNAKTKDSSASFTFQHPEDNKKEVEMELMMFNCA